ncbi:MAG: SpoIIE family protein phosphatase [Deltaproteobacteria bacterium]|nr:SpoIIE family protein phosphatase [Deltaproteobacteria bacterium]
MKPIEYLRRHCKLRQPSLARRITVYFILFGLVVFTATALLYIRSSEKHFTRVTAQLIRNQVMQIEGISKPDFIWHSVDGPLPGLTDLTRTLANFSAIFYSVSDIALYTRSTENGPWYLLYLDEFGTLRKRESSDDSLAKLKFHEFSKLVRALTGHFKAEAGGEEEFVSSAIPALFCSEDTFSMFVDITGRHDVNQYVVRLTAFREGLGGVIHRQIVSFSCFLVVALLIARFVGYYFARRISRPIEEISELASAVARGDLSQKASIVSADEVGSLAQSFNTMIDGLREWQRVKLIEFEMEKGRAIQQEFLPQQLPQLRNWEIAACFYPAGRVSGDFYDAFELPDGSIGLVIADVCDKGVGSALYMALFRSLIRVFAQQASIGIGSDSKAGARGEIIDPPRGLKAVSLTNNYIARNHDREAMFATLFFGILDPQSGTMQYINAGHEPLYVKNSSGIKSVIEPTGPAVGMFPDSDYRVGRVQLEQGDILVGYTDGVTDARSPVDELFTRSRLKAIITQPFASAGELIERVKSSVFSFIDVAPRYDDVTMLAVQRTGGGLFD